jgi:hypothetical protein|tara:strand:- start:904 stop:1182 length:279 start_codon:yes stop_codon:yes gene_type:complete
MNQFCKLLSPGVTLINRSIYNFSKKPLGFHMIPYDQQYESRDSISISCNVSEKILMNRKNYVKKFNPYLKSNVSDNLDQSLKDFYNKRYKDR